MNRNPFVAALEATVKPIRPSPKSQNAAPIGRRSPAGRLVRAKHLAPFALAAVIIGFNACSARSDSFVLEVDPIPECEAYAAKYEACLASIGSSDLARQHASTLRAGLRSNANAQDDASIQRQKASCIAGTDRLSKGCR